MAADRDIGRCKCPVCQSDRAHLRVSSKGLAYVVCNSCQAQVFARSDRSDELLRAMHRPEPDPIGDPAPTPAPAPEPAPPAPTAPPRPSWGLFGRAG